MDKLSHYKYIHFFLFPDLKFNPRLVEMINNPSNGFDMSEHLFVTPFKNVYEKLSCFPNVVFYKTRFPRTASIINKYAPKGDWLFLHSISWITGGLWIKKTYRKKIIWRTWGNDAYLGMMKPKQYLRNFAKKIINHFVKKIVKQFFAVGLSSSYIDELDIKEKYGNVKTLVVSYPSKNEILETSSNISHESLNVMIGHSANGDNKHIAVMKMLEKFKNENIHLFLVLAYGNPLYIKKVSDFAEKFWKGKVSIVDKRMPLNEYNAFVSTMDVAFFIGLKSYAVGNVMWLLHNKKKIVANRAGLWHRSMQQKGVPHICFDELEKMTFEEFKKPLCFKKDRYEGFSKFSYEEHVATWKKTLDYLSNYK